MCESEEGGTRAGPLRWEGPFPGHDSIPHAFSLGGRPSVTIECSVRICQTWLAPLVPSASLGKTTDSHTTEPHPPQPPHLYLFILFFSPCKPAHLSVCTPPLTPPPLTPQYACFVRPPIHHPRNTRILRLSEQGLSRGWTSPSPRTHAGTTTREPPMAVQPCP